MAILVVASYGSSLRVSQISLHKTAVKKTVRDLERVSELKLSFTSCLHSKKKHKRTKGKTKRGKLFHL